MSRSARRQAVAGVLLTGLLAAPSAEAALLFDELIESSGSSSSGASADAPSGAPEGPASSPDEWSQPQPDTVVERQETAQPPEVPPFDAAPVTIDPRLRFELRAGLWMVEDAGRLRTSNPSLGLGVTGRMSDQLRYDGGYLVTWVQDGTDRLHVLNLHHGLRARLHYAYPVGAAWITAGAGPALFVSMNTGPQTPFTVGFSGGVDAALGLETQVSERLIRFELGASARGLPRVVRADLHGAIAIGF